MAQKSYDISLQRFRVGTINRNDLAQAQQRLTSAKLTALRALIDWSWDLLTPDEKALTSKVAGVRLKKGMRVAFELGGGGGYGNPLERDPERVRTDVLRGYVTREGARKSYGVALRDDLSIDAAATQALRSGAAP